MEEPRRTALVLGGAEECQEGLSQTLSSKGMNVTIRPLGDYSAQEISKSVIEAEEKFGSIDTLVYCADGDGACGSSMLLDIDEQEWDDLMNRRLKGFFLACKYALPYLVGREKSRIFLLLPEKPTAGACGLHVYVADAACRAAVTHMSAELAAYGVLVESLTQRENGGFEEILNRC